MRQRVSLFVLFTFFGSFFPAASCLSHETEVATAMLQATNSNLAACIVFRSTKIIPNIQTMQYLLQANYINTCGQCLHIGFTLVINGQQFPQWGVYTFQPNVLYAGNFPFTGSYSTQRVDLVVSSANPCSASKSPSSSGRGVM